MTGRAYAEEVGDQKIERWLVDETLKSPAKPIDCSTVTNGK